MPSSPHAPDDPVPKPQPAASKPLVEERIAVGAMALLVVITLLNVLTRYFTDDSFAWTEELSVFLMVVLALAGASAIARRDRHIRIEVFYNREGPGGGQAPRRGLELFAGLCSTAVFLVLAVLFGRWVWDQYHFGETSMGLGVPLWWYGLWIPLLCAGATARAFSALWRAVHRTAGTQAEDLGDLENLGEGR